jgi:hypothetical protein
MTDALYGIGLNLPFIVAFGAITQAIVVRVVKKRNLGSVPINPSNQQPQ